MTDRLCVKAVTEPDSAESTETTDRARTESTEYNGKLRFSDIRIKRHYRFDLVYCNAFFKDDNKLITMV